MIKASDGSTRRSRRLLAIAIAAVLVADLIVAIAAGPLARHSVRTRAVVADPAVGQLLTGSSGQPVSAATAAHKHKKPPPTVGGTVVGAVGGLAGSVASGATGGGGTPSQPKHGGKHHQKPKSGSGTRHGSSPRQAPGNPRRPAPRADLQYIPSYTVLAQLNRRAAGFSSAHSKTRAMTVPKSWYGRTSVMPVTAESPTRVKVRLARRPNESQIWVRRHAVTLSSTKYALLVDISQHRLYLFKAGRQLGSFPVGVGLKQTPTPTGIYFLAFHAPPNGPGYGPVMLETSAHSNVFTTFEGGNDAIIAIHGPITAQSDAAIGKNGTRISNGCIRMHDSQLVKVAKVPDGTPIILAP